MKEALHKRNPAEDAPARKNSACDRHSDALPRRQRHHARSALRASSLALRSLANCVQLTLAYKGLERTLNRAEPARRRSGHRAMAARPRPAVLRAGVSRQRRRPDVLPRLTADDLKEIGSGRRPPTENHRCHRRARGGDAGGRAWPKGPGSRRTAATDGDVLRPRRLDGTLDPH